MTDGRTGRVFSVRLSDDDRELLTRAIHVRRRNGPLQERFAPISLGAFLVTAARREAQRIVAELEPGNTTIEASGKGGSR